MTKPLTCHQYFALRAQSLQSYHDMLLILDQGLHQGASLSLDKEEHVSNEFFFPLLVCIFGFTFLFITLVLIRTQTEIRKRRIVSLLREVGQNR